MELKPSKPPTTLKKDTNTILLSWDKIFENEDEDLMYLLFARESNWKALYRGRNTRFLVKDLAPSTVYEFKLTVFKKDVQIGDVLFKSATDFEPFGVTHMARALTQNKASLLRKIVTQRPVLLETPLKDNTFPLAHVVAKNDLNLVTLLITLGANVNSQARGTLRTPLMLALFKGYIQIAQLLIDKGADVDQRDCNELTVLHYAVDSGILDCVKFAVELNLDLNAKDNKGWTPLLRGVILEVDDKIIKFLIRKGTDTNIRDNNGFGFSEHCKMTKRYRWCKLNIDEIKTNL